MKKENIVKTKSFGFALDIIELYKKIVKTKQEHVMSRQLLKAGTSIGANIRESEFAQSKKDFINKMSISLKEANETDYWIDLLYKSDYINEELYEEIKAKSIELIRLLVSIVKSSKNNA